MYTKRDISLFCKHITYYKDGVRIAERGEDNRLVLVPEYHAPVAMTRSQAFRYWIKHFPRRTFWELPPLMEAATCLDPHEEADLCYYQTKDGEVFKGCR